MISAKWSCGGGELSRGSFGVCVAVTGYGAYWKVEHFQIVQQFCYVHVDAVIVMPHRPRKYDINPVTVMR